MNPAAFRARLPALACGDHARPTRGEKLELPIGASVSRNAGIAGIENARGRAREDHRLRARVKGRNLVVFLRPGRDAIPAQSVVQRQAGQNVPAILCEQPDSTCCARRNGLSWLWLYWLGTPIRKSAKSTPVSVPEKTKLPLNCAMGWAFTWSA